jgi:hypothetical protein
MSVKSPSSNHASKASSPALSSKGNKVTRADFESSDVLALADTAKSMVRMSILFGNWETMHSGKSGSQCWAADILQSVVEEEPSMKKALRHAFKDEARKENLLTYVRPPFFTSLCSPLIAPVDLIWQGGFAQYIHWQSPPVGSYQLWSDRQKGGCKSTSGMAVEEDAVHIQWT